MNDKIIKIKEVIKKEEKRNILPQISLRSGLSQPNIKQIELNQLISRSNSL